jgi:hypothetical protein
LVEAERERLELRTAAYFFIVEGAFSLSDAIGYFLHAPHGLDSLDLGGNELVTLVSGLLALAIGIGIQYRRPIWRTIGAWSAGLSCGYALAVVLFAYWPLGPMMWNRESLPALLTVAITGWQLWAVTNRNVRAYFRIKSAPVVQSK